MVAVRDRIEEFGDAVVVVVTFGDQSAVAEYLSINVLELPLLIDVDRSGYRAFGCGRGSLARVWGWKAAIRYMDILRGRGLRAWQRPVEDTLQLAGDFVVDANGVLSYAFWGEGPDERPLVDDLIAAV